MSFMEWVRDFHDVLKDKPVSLSMSLDCCFVSIAFLISRPLYLFLLSRLLVLLCRLIWRGYSCSPQGLPFTFHTTRLEGGFFHPGLDGASGLSNVQLPTFRKGWVGGGDVKHDRCFDALSLIRHPLKV